MELLTQYLPNGEYYNFTSLNISPMKFAEILEYLEAVPSNQVEKLYLDYSILVKEEPKIDSLLLTDLDYVIFFKKGLTISKNLEFNTTAKCPVCGVPLNKKIKLSDIKFNKIDPQFINGIEVELSGSFHLVKMPTVGKFLNIFSKYRRYKKVTDLKLIKLIALFEQSDMYLQKYEDLVINSTYEDITVLTTLMKLFYNSVEPLEAQCPTCIKSFEMTEIHKKALLNEYLETLTDDQRNSITEIDKEIYLINKIEELKAKHGGMVLGIDSLITDFFRDILYNNKFVESKIKFGEIR